MKFSQKDLGLCFVAIIQGFPHFRQELAFFSPFVLLGTKSREIRRKIYGLRSFSGSRNSEMLEILTSHRDVAKHVETLRLTLPVGGVDTDENGPRQVRRIYD